jgi:alpha-L-fucosidase 2
VRLWYDRPIDGWEDARTRWAPAPRFDPRVDNPWYRALPVGNGRLGGMVFGGVAVERVLLNEETLRGGGPQDRSNPQALALLPEVRRLIFAGRYAEAGQLVHSRLLGAPPQAHDYQTVGDLWLHFAGVDAAEAYHRELDLERGIVTVRYRSGGVEFVREVFTSAPDQVVVVHVRCSRPGGLDLEAELDRPNDGAFDGRGCEVWCEGGRALALRGTRLKFSARVLACTDEVIAAADQTPAGADRLKIAGVDQATSGGPRQLDRKWPPISAPVGVCREAVPGRNAWVPDGVH